MKRQKRALTRTLGGLKSQVKDTKRRQMKTQTRSKSEVRRRASVLGFSVGLISAMLMLSSTEAEACSVGVLDSVSDINAMSGCSALTSDLHIRGLSGSAVDIELTNLSIILPNS